MNPKRIAVVAGTRPEVIKMAPVYAALKASPRLTPVLFSTGQHRQMLDQAFAVFGLRPDIELNLMQPGQSLSDLTSRVLTGMTTALRDVQPAAILLQGDTTTVLGSALAAFYAGVPIGHVEAGLRTGDMKAPFPEEMNRRLTSPLARWNFCPTDFSCANLLRENTDAATCHVTGNTVIDALLWVRDRIRAKGIRAEEVGVRLGIREDFTRRFLAEPNRRWILVTGHRRESFGGGFERICDAINRLTRTYDDLGILYPVHLNPLVQEPVKRLLGDNPRVALVQPAAYEDFIWLLDRCTLALSDSGGVQEEAPSLGKPVLVMRDTTERPEGVSAGTCTLVGTDPDRILREAGILLSNPTEYARRAALRNPYGDGQAALRIREILERTLAD